MKISVSEINAFLRCRRLWRYTSDNMMRLESTAPSVPFFIGLGVHEALEHFYRGDKPDMLDTFFTWCANTLQEYEHAENLPNTQKFLDAVDLGAAMIHGYELEYGSTPEDDRDGMRVLVTEQEYSVPVPFRPDGELVGRIDGLAYDSGGRLWVLEHKTYTTAPKMLELNPQITGYTWAIQQLVNAGQFRHLSIEPGTRVFGGWYNGLRKQAPGPRVTVPLFLRDQVSKTPYELEQFANQLSIVYYQMAEAKQAEALQYPSFTNDCSWCNFIDPCTANQVGADEDYMLKAIYRVKAQRGSVYTADSE